MDKQALKQTIPNIKDLNTFDFEDNGIIRCYRAGRIGTGMAIKVQSVEIPKKYNYKIVLPEELAPGRTKKELESGMPNMRTHIPFYSNGKKVKYDSLTIDDPDDLNSEIKSSQSTGAPIRHGNVFKCPNDACDAKFLNYVNLTKHELSQNCYKKSRSSGQQSVETYVVREYCSKFGASGLQKKLTSSEKRYMATHVFESVVDITLTDFLLRYVDVQKIAGYYPKGFALRVRAKPTNYNQKQIDYLKQLFLEGERPNK